MWTEINSHTINVRSTEKLHAISSKLAVFWSYVSYEQML